MTSLMDNRLDEKQLESERTEFEYQFQEDECNLDGRYMHQRTQDRWEGWKRRASLAFDDRTRPGLVINEEVYAALVFALWHHQGAHSAVGQPIRRVLSMSQYQRLSAGQLSTARRVQAALERKATS